MCEHFTGPVAPPDHEYVATATALVPTSAAPEQVLTDRFTIAPMRSYVASSMHELRDGVSLLRGLILVTTTDGFQRPAPPGLVTVERLEGPTWLKIGEAVSAADGNVAVKADRLLPAGTYVRFLYPGDYWVVPYPAIPWLLSAAWSPPPITTGTPPSGRPVVALPDPLTVKIKAVSHRSKLKVDVNPNRGTKFYVFQVQRKNADGSWKARQVLRDSRCDREEDPEPAQGHLPGVGAPRVRVRGGLFAERGDAEEVIGRPRRASQRLWSDAPSAGSILPV